MAASRPRSWLLVLLVLALLGCAEEAEQTNAPDDALPPTVTSPPATVSPPPATVAPPKLETVPEADGRGATGLSASVGCTQQEPRQPVATLRWKPAGGGEQRVVVTIFADDFERGDFDSSRPLAPERSTLDWRRVQGQALHRWRVLTRIGDSWVSSPTAQFEGTVCVADYVSP